MDIDRAGHRSFSDVCFYQEEAARQPELPTAIVDLIEAYSRSGCLPRLIDAYRAHEIVIHYVTAFLLQHIIGAERSAALDPATAEQFP